MEERLVRQGLIIGEAATEKLKSSAVAIFGIGGVGSFAAEAIARGGIGRICLIDNDTVAKSNINRQLIALNSTIGRRKAEVMAERIRDIAPDANVVSKCIFYGEATKDEIDLGIFDYVIDAIDTVSAKLLLIEEAQKAGTPIICAMGAGNKLDPTRFEVADIYDTSVCPLCRVMRKELRQRGIDRLKVVYSKEEPREHLMETENAPGKRQTPGSVSFVPPVMGMIIAGEVIKDIIKRR